MSEPVRLSRERWEALWRFTESMRVIQIGDYPPLIEPQSVRVQTPTETRGVIFLPAEYVPDVVPANERRHILYP